MTMQRKLRMGLIGNSHALLAWQAECIRILLVSGIVELKLIVTQTQDDPAQPPHRRHQPKEESNSLLFDAYFRFFRNSSRAGRIINPAPKFKDVEWIKAEIASDERSGLFVADEDVTKICDYDLDFILLFDPPTLAGAICSAARYGVWSFRFGDGTNGGEPAGFWEIYRGEPVTTAALHRLTNRTDTSAVLYSGSLPTIAWSWPATYDLVHLSCAEWPTRVCRDILNQCADYFEGEPTPLKLHSRRRPSNWQTLLAVLKMLRSFTQAQIRSLIIREQWHIGIARVPIQSLIYSERIPTVEWLPDPPRTRFFADPFAIRRGTELAILFEDFDQLHGKGHISAVHSSDGGHSFTPPAPISGGAFDLANHKSYPYLFEHEGEIFCVPETVAANEVSLHHAVQFPWHWERIGTLFENTSVVDPTLFHHDGYWWMFFTSGGAESNVKLNLAFAQYLLGPWSLHPANPVKTDISSARPGGTPFVHDGLLYRPAQDSSRTYGGSLAIHRVEKLTTTQFQERLVCRLTPKNHGRFANGFHTLAAAGDLCIVDGKRFVALPELLPAMLKEKFGSMVRQLFR
jgi:hypothetical protein